MGGSDFLINYSLVFWVYMRYMLHELVNKVAELTHTKETVQQEWKIWWYILK